jgi:MFS-type transporter involved in bile tolerance (Atg22 family)
MGAARDYIVKEYGRAVETIQNVIVLGAAAPAVQVLPNNPNRLSWVIWNLGAGATQIAPTSAVGPLFGSNIAGAGGMIGVTVREDGELVSNQMWGFSTVGSTIYILQTVAI